MVAPNHKDTYGCESHFEDLREVLKELGSSFEQLAKVEGTEAVKAVSESAQELLSRANAMLDDLGEAVVTAKGAAARSRAYLEDTIRKQPLMAVGIAAVAGLLLASLRRR